MVYVPAGEFVMGSPEGDPDQWGSQHPQHSVYLDYYWIDRTELTNAHHRHPVGRVVATYFRRVDYAYPNIQ